MAQRLIDPDAVIAPLKEEYKKVKQAFDETSVFQAPNDVALYGALMQELGAVIGMIEDEPTIDAELHWTPCSEKLPEIGQWVLCQCRAGIMDLLRFTADGSWDKDYPNTEYMSSFVIAWMPLPKPYEAANHE